MLAECKPFFVHRKSLRKAKHSYLSSVHVQLVDEAVGPSTKREYEVTRVPVGSALCGQVVNFLGCPSGSEVPLGMDAQLPLLNDSLDMKSREQINSALFTGVKVSSYHEFILTTCRSQSESAWQLHPLPQYCFMCCNGALQSTVVDVLCIANCASCTASEWYSWKLTAAAALCPCCSIPAALDLEKGVGPQAHIHFVTTTQA